MEEELNKKTDEWLLYEKHKQFLAKDGFYEKATKNIRFYSGDQWHGINLGNTPKVQYNFIKPVLDFKLSSLDSKEYEITVMSNNYDSTADHEAMNDVCNKLNSHTAVVWEQKKMNRKMRRMKKDAGILGEGIVYFYFKESEDEKPKEVKREIPVTDEVSEQFEEDNEPATELMKKVVSGEFECENLLPSDVYYGNENESDIQNQPYILIKKRMTLDDVKELARANGVSEEKISAILADKDLFEQIGDRAKDEITDQVLVISKLWKENGTIHFKQSTKTVVIREDEDLGLKYYPLAHMLWQDVYGSARGKGEVEDLIDNQIEANKTLLRRAVIIQEIAYPKRVVNTDKIKNPDALNEVGGTIELTGGIDNINNYVGYLQPAQTSTEAIALQTELIQTSRELANASDVATGAINPEQASGRAILAVQEAAQQPLIEYLNSFKEALEDIGLIIFDIWRAYNTEGMDVYTKQENKDLKEIDDGTNKYELTRITSEQLENLKPFIKIEITSTTPYDKYAQEQSYENLLVKQLISFEEWVELLTPSSVMNRRGLINIIRRRKEKQGEIQKMQDEANKQAMAMQQNMQQDQVANQVEQDVRMNDMANATEKLAGEMMGG